MSLPLLLTLALFTAHGDPERVQGWRMDLETFVKTVRKVHADPGRPAFSAAFEDEAQELREDIPSLTDDQVLARMMKLAAVLDDGHTVVYGPGQNSPLQFERRTLPFKFYLFPGGLYIVDGIDDWVDFAGSRVVRFGEIEAEEALRRMSEYRGGENEMTWKWMGPQFYVGKLLLLSEVGVSVKDGAIEMTIQTAKGKEQTLSIQGGEHRARRKLRPFPLGSAEPPLYLSNVDTNFWLKSTPDKKVVYFQFNQIRDTPGQSIAAFSAKLRLELRNENARAVIVDVRHNNGGNNSLIRPLVRALVEFDTRSPDHRIYVLTGRNTFSACQNFINQVERWTDATFVGEPSSSSPNFTGEENEFVLPYSQITGSISNRYWQDSDPWDTRVWIEPDMPVDLTVDDYVNGLDPVLEKVLERVREPHGL